MTTSIMSSSCTSPAIALILHSLDHLIDLYDTIFDLSSQIDRLERLRYSFRRPGQMIPDKCRFYEELQLTAQDRLRITRDSLEREAFKQFRFYLDEKYGPLHPDSDPDEDSDCNREDCYACYHFCTRQQCPRCTDNFWPKYSQRGVDWSSGPSFDTSMAEAYAGFLREEWHWVNSLEMPTGL